MYSAVICFPEHRYLFFYDELLFDLRSIFSMDSGFVEEGPLQQLLLWSFIKILDPYEYDCTFIFYLLFLTGA